MNYPEELLALLDEVVDFSRASKTISYAFLAGDYATKSFNEKSPIEILIFSSDPTQLTENQEWIQSFGIVLKRELVGSTLKVKFSDKSVHFTIHTEKNDYQKTGGAKLLYSSSTK